MSLKSGDQTQLSDMAAKLVQMLDTASPYCAIIPYIIAASILAVYLPSLRNVARRLCVIVEAHRKIQAAKRSPTASPIPSPVVTKEHDFPADWWTSPKLYDLEKRAILSKTWLHVTHTSLFQEPGDYRTFQIADFSFIVILGKDRKLRAFHNVCRHRAYNVCDKTQGTLLALRCRYHGWTYDSKGKLVHAPKFEGIEGFNKADNGLFEVRSWSDSSGFVYVNFDIYGSDGLTIRVGVPMRAKLRLLESWTEQGDFNWKMAMPTGSFRIRSLATKNRLPEIFGNFANSLASWKWPSEFELSPLTRLLRSAKGDLFLTISISPSSPESCKLACHLYSAREDSVLEIPSEAIRKEMAESIQSLQTSFGDIKIAGEVPDASSQEPLLAETKAHSRLERLMGAEVHPASRLRESSQACQVADDLCRELEAAAGSTNADALAW